jgi:MFS family permease
MPGDATTESAPPASDASTASRLSEWAFMLRALQHRNYRLFFMGQGVSLVGTWLTTTATSWLVVRIAMREGTVEAATLLGAVRFAAQVPMSALAPAAGVLVDRWNRHRVLMMTQALSMLQSAALAALTFSHRINVANLVGLCIFQGVINAFDAPARQAFVVEIVDRRDDVPNAIALNSSMFNGARLIGPAIAGILIAKIGEAACFTIDAVSYLAVLIALMMMHLKKRPVIAASHSMWKDMREGVAYAAGFPPVRALLALAGFISLTVAAFQTLMPIFALRVSVEHGAMAFGFLGAATGVGALGGAVFLASRRTVRGLGRVVATAAMLAGVSMFAFGLIRSFPLMLALGALTGYGMIVNFAGCNTMLQTIVEDRMRARLMSFFVVAIMGAAPLGSLVSGWIADRIGASGTMMIAGGISVAAAAYFLTRLPALRELIRPIYISKGIIPEVATGLDERSASPQ